MNEENSLIKNEIMQGEITQCEQSAFGIQERAQIDSQIATAKQYPRSLSTFKERAVTYATLDEETAASCIYRRPVGKDASGKQTFAEGLSIRTAEIVAACYGNIRVAARIIEQTDRYVKCQGAAHDLEMNVFATSEVVESSVDKYGKPFNERMRVVVAKAALAKARRDATFQVVPRALAKPIENAVRDMLFGNAKSMTKRREAVADWIKKLGIPEERVFNAIGVSGIDDMNAKHLEMLTGVKTAIINGDTTPDEAFPPVNKDKFAASVSAKSEEKKHPENVPLNGEEEK